MQAEPLEVLDESLQRISRQEILNALPEESEHSTKAASPVKHLGMNQNVGKDLNDDIRKHPDV